MADCRHTLGEEKKKKEPEDRSSRADSADSRIKRTESQR